VVLYFEDGSQKEGVHPALNVFVPATTRVLRCHSVCQQTHINQERNRSLVATLGEVRDGLRQDALSNVGRCPFAHEGDVALSPRHASPRPPTRPALPIPGRGGDLDGRGVAAS